MELDGVDDADLAECVRRILEAEECATRPTVPSVRAPQAATLPSFAAVEDASPETLPPTARARTSPPPYSGRYSVIHGRRRPR